MTFLRALNVEYVCEGVCNFSAMVQKAARRVVFDCSIPVRAGDKRRICCLNRISRLCVSRRMSTTCQICHHLSRFAPDNFNSWSRPRNTVISLGCCTS